MSIFGGLFGAKEKQDSNFEHIAHAVHNHLGFDIDPPSADVLEAIDQMTARELLHFDNLQSVPGMQALFAAKSIRASSMV